MRNETHVRQCQQNERFFHTGGEAMGYFFITERAERDLTILDLAGRLSDERSNILLRNTLQHLLNVGKAQVILNCSRVSHISFAGVKELIAGNTKFSEAPGQLKICSLRSTAIEAVQLTLLLELTTICELFPTERGAVDSFQIRRNRFPRYRGVRDQVSNESSAVIDNRMRAIFSEMNRRNNVG
jgi:anti-anti-sigma regulatory factor